MTGDFPADAPQYSDRSHPATGRPGGLRLAVALGFGAFLLSMLFVNASARETVEIPGRWNTPYIARADTDTVDVRADSLRLDSLIVEALRADTVTDDPGIIARMRTDTALVASLLSDSLLMVRLRRPPAPLDSLRWLLGVRARRLAPRHDPDPWTAAILPRETRPFSTGFGRYWTHQVELDSTDLAFTVRESVGAEEIRYPIRLDYETYRRARLERDMQRNWKQLILDRERQRQTQSRGGLGFNIIVPGGRNTAFTTIFGTREVDLRVNGSADIKAGFDYRKSDQQVSVTGKPSQLDPEFKQELSLGITGTIGDKLEIDVQYDSRNQFDFQNQLKMQYTGYEDEIIQSIEAGNVFLQNTGQLIRGGQSLFGIKSELQLGGITLTSVISQQEGQSNSLSIDGGSEETEFDLRPTDYDEGIHFFLGYYFRNRWEDALADPPNIRVANGFERITEIEVWKLTPTRPEEQNVRQIVSVVDLGESPDILAQADEYTQEVLPSPDNDQYDDSPGGEVDTQLRDGDASPGSYLETDKDLSSSDFQVGKFKRLERGRDYDVDEVLGYITLSQRVQESEAIAVAFRYRANGRTFAVGDFSTETGGSDGGQNEKKLFLKLIRPVQLRQPAPESNFDPAAWYLEMRNIYRLPSRGITPNDFDLQVYYEPPGSTPSKTLPAVGGTQTALQILGLDRVNANQALSPDDEFDFLVNYTIEPGDGTLIFPYLQPFGGRLENVILEGPGSPEAKDGLIETFVFDRLYTEKKANARRDSQHDVYRIRGSYKGNVQSFYDLRAYSGLVPGSVRVTSGGTPLQEGTDYYVDYNSGTVEIINPAFLTAGREIDIDYEQNSFVNIQKKTLLGLRADYVLDDRFSMGATLMRMNEKSPIDKFRIGEEPISNTIWGVDGTLELEPMWLTRAIDRVPLLQTKEPSRVSLTGEFAQLRPNHTQTIAFERTREDLQDAGRDFSSDELRGTSYVDDFEGFENTFSLMQPGTWGLSAAPDSVAAVDRMGVMPGTVADSLRTNWRGSFGWYRINANMLREIPTIAYNGDAIRIYRIDEVFPNRDTRAEIDPTLETIDVYFNPRTRGPYNYTRDLQDFLNNPRESWGGMMQRLPDGFTDFSLKNIDFVEFVFRPFPENPAEDAGRDAKLYIDLGSISEDVIPDEKLNNEDGLSMSTITETSINKWGRLPNSTQNSVVDIDDETNRTEDLGLDGVASAGGNFPEFATEDAVFADFLNSLSSSITDPAYQAERAKALSDPSGDDYHYFGNNRFYENSEFFPNGATFQQRFTHYFAGQEMNAFETQSTLAENTSVRRGNSRFPDSEDRNLNSSVDTDNSYFQYEVPLSQVALDSLAQPTAVDDYIVGEITGAEGEGTGWYQVRIPVQQFTRRVGDIQDFSLIESIRMWTTGHEVPITMRFATLELVGSQWQKSDAITAETDTPMDTVNTGTNLRISSINNEENADIYAPPLGAVVSQSRLASGRVQNSREQALVLRVENLMPGSQRAIFKTQNQGLDLLRYSNLRMFVHMHGMLRDGRDLSNLPTDEGRSKAKLFVRLGANETNDYYEYEMPLTPSAETSGSPEILWQTSVDYNGIMQDLGSMNIELGAFNQLKVARDRAAFPTDSVFFNVTDGELTVPDAPNAEEFAPPGTRLGIKGTPSLGKVNSVVIGIRNAADSTLTGFEHIIEDMTVWINELRVSGYDQTNGWAALGNADFQLADIGSIKATIDRRTDGFGSLSSSLGDRQQINEDNWSVTSQFNVNKLLPDRYGWGVPLNVQVSSNTSTPRFAPNRGDVRLEEITAQIDEREDLDNAEKEEAKTEAIQAAQTHSFTTSVSTRVGKSGSDSPVMKKTIDALQFSYSQSTSDARSPTQEMNDTWRWSSTLAYSVRNNAKTVRPFFFLSPIPLLNVLSDIDFNYIPTSFSTSGTFARNFSESQERPVVAPGDTSNIPLSIRFPLRETHSFSHDRSVQLQYNPFGFLNLSFDTNTDQSLNTAGVDTLFSTVTQDQLIAGLTPEEALAQGRIDSTEFQNAFEQRRLDTNSATSVIGDFITGRTSARAERHGQRFSAALRPRLNNVPALDWMQLSNITYTASYTWQNGAVGRLTGASIRNSVDLRSDVTFRLQDLWRKFGFYESIEEAQQNYKKEQQEARQAAEREEAAQQRAEDARRAAEAEGREVPEDVPEETDETEEVEKDPGPGLSGRLSSLGRQLFLAATGIRDFNISYNGLRSSSSSNVGTPILGDDGRLVGTRTPFNVIDAFKGDGPSLGYRFGFDRSVDLEKRILDPSLQISDVRENSDRFQGRTSLSPSNALSINLNWNIEYGQTETFTFRPITNMDDIVTGVATTPTRDGRNSASVWAFGASYLDMFESQLNTYRSDINATGEENPPIVGDEDGNGRVVLTNASVVQDFRQAFVRGGRTIDERNLQPFPRPSWQVTYSGASDWPLVRRLARSMSISHGYNAEYSTDYNTNTAFSSDDSLNTVDLGGRQIQYVVEPFRTGTVRINERFQPLIGVDISWNGGIQTGVRWSTNNSYSLSTANFEVSESETQDLTIDLGYQKTGLRLPFLGGKRLQNRMNLSVSITRSNTRDERLRLRRALEQAATDPDFVPADALKGDNVSLVTAHKRTIITPQVSYQFSNRVSANFTLRYEQFDSEDSRQPSSTNINGTFNIRVSISN